MHTLWTLRGDSTLYFMFFPRYCCAFNWFVKKVPPGYISRPVLNNNILVSLIANMIKPKSACGKYILLNLLYSKKLSGYRKKKKQPLGRYFWSATFLFIRLLKFQEKILMQVTGDMHIIKNGIHTNLPKKRCGWAKSFQFSVL